MALTTEATTNLPASQEPSGWTDPATTITFSGDPVIEEFEATIAVSGLTHASNEVTGLTQVVAAVKSWVDGTWATGTLKLDTALTIDGIITITSIRRDNAESTQTARLYLTGTDSFIVKGTFRYE